MIQPDFTGVQLKLRKAEGKTSVFDPIRKKWVALTPEEHVRQYMLQYLMGAMQYPPGLIAVEKSIMVGTRIKRFDIVVYSRDHKPWMLVECKAPDVPVTEATLHQLLAYQRVMQCSYWLLTNGVQTYCANATDIENISWMNLLPAYEL